MSCSKPVENNVLNYSEFKENMTSKFGSDDVVLSCFVIEDKNVMSDEIIIDIYPKEDDYYVYISKDEFVVPNLGKLNEDDLIKGNITNLILKLLYIYPKSHLSYLI